MKHWQSLVCRNMKLGDAMEEDVMPVIEVQGASSGGPEASAGCQVESKPEEEATTSKKVDDYIFEAWRAERNGLELIAVALQAAYPLEVPMVIGEEAQQDRRGQHGSSDGCQGG